jgi:hypothetical protein
MEMNVISIVKIGSQISEENLLIGFRKLGLKPVKKFCWLGLKETGSQIHEENLQFGFGEIGCESTKKNLHVVVLLQKRIVEMKREKKLVPILLMLINEKGIEGGVGCNSLSLEFLLFRRLICSSSDRCTHHRSHI